MAEPLIVYIPGLKPKPEPVFHREQLLRCLRTAVERLDQSVAAKVTSGDSFRLVSWTFDFYGEHRDIAHDLSDIDAVLQRERASEHDIEIATSWSRRFLIWLFHVANYLPFVLPKAASQEIEVHLRDYFRYVRDNRGIAEEAREKLKSVLREAHDAGRPVMLMAHSMGSVIAWDALWQLSRQEDHALKIDLLLTSGSPLGQKIVKRHLFGKERKGAERYPANIRNWVNVAAIGELTAIDRRLRNDFSAMTRHGLVEDIDDREVFNFYYMNGRLNVHGEYGYLVNEVTARCVVDWWREADRASSG